MFCSTGALFSAWSSSRSVFVVGSAGTPYVGEETSFLGGSIIGHGQTSGRDSSRPVSWMEASDVVVTFGVSLGSVGGSFCGSFVAGRGHTSGCDSSRPVSCVGASGVTVTFGASL